MTLRVCLDCTTAFAVGIRLCPHCRSERNAEEGSAQALGIQHGVPVEVEEEDNMPKITRHGGPSIAGEEPAAEESSEVVEPLPEPAGDAEQDSTERAAAPDYEAWTVEQLKDQLDSRGLPKTGKKDDLVLRLLEDDDTRTAETE